MSNGPLLHQSLSNPSSTIQCKIGQPFGEFTTCIRRIQEELGELVRKHDYRFSDEPRGNEMLSWRRGAKLCAGNPGVR